MALLGSLAALAVMTALAVRSQAQPAPRPAGPPPLLVQPAQIQLNGLGDEHGLLVTVAGADGGAIDVSGASALSSTDPAVVALTPEGRCRAVADGRAEIVVSYGGATARVPVVVSGAGGVGGVAAPRAPSFRQDVVPILTAAGCNAGGCHGKLAGQNGFRLSLRGYAPEQDHAWITGELDARRINFVEPEESLLLQKPLGRVPHEGGNRLVEGSRAHQTLRDWIAARAPGPDAAEADAERLEVLPGDRNLRVGQTQRLLVLAHYPGGRARDVTWLCQFFSNDEATVSATREGVVKSLRPGAAAVRAHFQGKVGVITLTTPFDNRVSPETYAAKANEHGVELIDGPVFAKLRALRLPPSPPCDDATFLRRASLDATGTLPSPEEAAAFLADPSTDKRARLVDALLGKPEFVDYWTLQLCDLLQNRKERDHDARGAKNVRAFQNWLREQVAANRPWDALARDVLLASGDSVRAPQIGYFIYNIGEKQNVEESDVADSVAMAFLGTRIGCARCHNHPLEKYTQDDYYHFAAYFSRVTIKHQTPDKGPTTLAIGTRDEQQLLKQLADAEKAAGGVKEGAKEAAQAKEAAKRLADLRKQLEAARAKPPGVGQPRTGKFMAPQALDGTPVAWQPGHDPRQALADWMTDSRNENFSGAMVNRLWKHFLGVGLVEPVDDLRSSNPPSNVALWSALTREFTAGHYDLKHLMRLILNSRTYQLASMTLAENEQDRRFYSHYYARRLPAEALSDAITAATGVPDSFPGYPVGLRAAQLADPGVSSYFLTTFGRSERVTACACERNGDVTLPQLLHLGNGDDLARKIRSGEGRLAALLAAEKDDRKATEALFLATLSRPPTAEESAAVAAALAEARASGDARQEVFRDLFWALLNAKEFAFNH